MGKVKKEVISNSSNGNDDQTADPAVPILVDPFGLEVKARAASCGGEFFLILDQNGHVWSCGDGSDGALGHGGTDDSSEPKMISASAFIVEDNESTVPSRNRGKVRSVSAGQAFCAALTEPLHQVRKRYCDVTTHTL